MAIDPNISVQSPASPPHGDTSGLTLPAGVAIPTLRVAGEASVAPATPANLTLAQMRRLAEEIGKSLYTNLSDRLNPNPQATAPDYFGTRTLSGENLDQTAIANYAAQLYLSDGLSDTNLDEQTQTYRLELQKARADAAQALIKNNPSLTHEAATAKLNNFADALADRGEVDSLTDVLPNALSALGIHAHPSTIDEAEKLRQREAEIRDNLAANMAKGETPTTGAGATTTEPAAGEINDDVIHKMTLGTIESINKLSAASPQYPLTDGEKAMMTWAVWKEATWLKERYNITSDDGLTADYIATDVVMGVKEYGAAIGQTAGSTMSAIYDEYVANGGTESLDDLKANVKNAYVTLKDTIGEEGAKNFKHAAEQVSAYHMVRYQDNVGSWIAGDGHREAHYGHYKMTESDLAFFQELQEHYPNAITEIFGSSNPDLTQNTVTATQAFAEVRTVNMTHYAGAISTSNHGSGKVPVVLDHLTQGIGPMGAYHAANGTKYIPSDSVAEEWRSQGRLVDSLGSRGVSRAQPVQIDGGVDTAQVGTPITPDARSTGAAHTPS